MSFLASQRSEAQFKKQIGIMLPGENCRTQFHWSIDSDSSQTFDQNVRTPKLRSFYFFQHVQKVNPIVLQ